MTVIGTMLHIPTGVSSWDGLEDEICCSVNMLVVPEFGQGSKRFGGCCNAGFDVIVILEAVRNIGSKVLEVLGVCHKSVFHIHSF